MAVKYSCELCRFETDKLDEYNSHLDKHLREAEASQKVSSTRLDSVKAKLRVPLEELNPNVAAVARRTKLILVASVLAIALSLIAVITPGQKGDAGRDGGPGAQGPPGIQGNVGPAGPRGITGEKGNTGEAGLAGTNGKDGKDGVSGYSGITIGSYLTTYNPTRGSSFIVYLSGLLPQPVTVKLVGEDRVVTTLGAISTSGIDLLGRAYLSVVVPKTLAAGFGNLEVYYTSSNQLICTIPVVVK